MTGIIIVNGPFGSGKTTVANALSESLQSLLGIPTRNLSDGPHLVHEIRDVAHGMGGGSISASHHHPWVEDIAAGHHHSGLNGDSHFPFTVTNTKVTDAMIRAYLSKLSRLCENGDQGLIIAELGTGISDGRISRIDLSTTRFLQLAREQLCWNALKEKTIGVVTVDATWETRLARDGRRPQVADGVNESWGMVLAGMNITRDPDFGTWNKEFGPGKVVCVENNSDFCLRRLDPVLDMITLNRVLIERRKKTKEG